MHHEFYFLAKKISEQKHKELALATVVEVRGSAYRREGTRMIVDENGNWHGNISGGCLEGDILIKAQKVIKSQKSVLITYDTRESENKVLRVALGCSGIITILIEPVNNEIRDMSETLLQRFTHEKTTFLSTTIQISNHTVFVHRKINEKTTFLSDTKSTENECRVEKQESKIILYEKIGLPRKLVIWGSGPDVKPLAQFSSQLGWKTIVVADQISEMEKANIENVHLIKSNHSEFLNHVSLHKNTAVVLVSHDYYKDYFVLERIISSKVKYIGIMGPKRRGSKMVEELLANHPGLVLNHLNLFYPVGLDIGSDNPAEIALSIIAEIQAVFSGKNASSLKEKSSRIHDDLPEEEIQDYNPNEQVCSINQIQ